MSVVSVSTESTLSSVPPAIFQHTRFFHPVRRLSLFPSISPVSFLHRVTPKIASARPTVELVPPGTCGHLRGMPDGIRSIPFSELPGTPASRACLVWADCGGGVVAP